MYACTKRRTREDRYENGRNFVTRGAEFTKGFAKRKSLRVFRDCGASQRAEIIRRLTRTRVNSTSLNFNKAFVVHPQTYIDHVCVCVCVYNSALRRKLMINIVVFLSRSFLFVRRVNSRRNVPRRTLFLSIDNSYSVVSRRHRLSCPKRGEKICSFVRSILFSLFRT